MLEGAAEEDRRSKAREQIDGLVTVGRDQRGRQTEHRQEHQHRTGADENARTLHRDVTRIRGSIQAQNKSTIRLANTIAMPPRITIV